MECVFFMQKSSYERRFSDWSSDVCSSDLSNLAKNRAKTHRDCEILRSLWVNELVKPEGRHSISNLIAPLLLAEAMEASGLGNADSVIAQIGRASRRAGVCQYV